MDEDPRKKYYQDVAKKKRTNPQMPKPGTDRLPPTSKDEVKNKHEEAARKTKPSNPHGPKPKEYPKTSPHLPNKDEKQHPQEMKHKNTAYDYKGEKPKGYKTPDAERTKNIHPHSQFEYNDRRGWMH